MAAALAFVDFSPSMTTIVDAACQLARTFGMQLILMHVSTPDADFEGSQPRRDISRSGVATEMRRFRRELNLLALQCTKLGVKTDALLVRGHSVRGNPIPKMVSELNRVKPSLIVMGTHQHGRLFEAMFGSASAKVIHKAACPILLIPSQRQTNFLATSKRTMLDGYPHRS